MFRKMKSERKAPEVMIKGKNAFYSKRFYVSNDGFIERLSDGKIIDYVDYGSPYLTGNFQNILFKSMQVSY